MTEFGNAMLMTIAAHIANWIRVKADSLRMQGRIMTADIYDDLADAIAAGEPWS